jgi:ABC-type branched-subunit amino acid transport system ATPase component
MNAGKEIFEGSLSEAVKDSRVIEVYFGEVHD